MLHDIGHYPFSHTIEQAYKDCGGGKRSEKLEDVVDGSSIDNNTGDVPDSETEIEHHEHLGAYIILNTDYKNGITKILKEEEDFEEEDIEDIANIIQKKSSTIWYNNIINSEMDADRFDYLIRDSKETGVSYGNFDINYLIRHLKLAAYKGSKVVAVENSVVFSVEHYLLARYFWYSQILHDRTISIFNEMARRIYDFFLENKLILLKI